MRDTLDFSGYASSVYTACIADFDTFHDSQFLSAAPTGQFSWSHATIKTPEMRETQ